MLLDVPVRSGAAMSKITKIIISVVLALTVPIWILPTLLIAVLAMIGSLIYATLEDWENGRL